MCPLLLFFFFIHFWLFLDIYSPIAVLRIPCDGRLNNFPLHPLPKYVYFLVPRTYECYLMWQKELFRYD